LKVSLDGYAEIAKTYWRLLRPVYLTFDQDVDGRIILRWIFRELEGVVGTG
jgi:hypothetical protein